MQKPHPCAGHKGRFGGRNRLVGLYEHEIRDWAYSRFRTNDGGHPRPPQSPPDSPKILRMKEVLARTGLSRVTILRLEKLGRFPQRICLLDEEAAD